MRIDSKINPILTKRTLLRRLLESDFENMYNLESDAEVVKWIPSRVPQSHEEVTRRLKDQIKAQKYYEPFGIWAAETKENKFVGWFIQLSVKLPPSGWIYKRLKKHCLL